KQCCMKFEAITLKDIAKALGLSTSTVSRALRDSYEINEETKRRVLEYAQKFNYQPNPAALGLKERRTRSIGVIVSEIANTFFSQAINGIDSTAYNRGYNVIIAQSHESFEREILNLQYLTSRSIDGLLISLSTETKDIQHIKTLHEKGLPVVFFDRITEEINTHKVTVDNFRGAYEVVEYLIQMGYRRIAHLANAKYLSITIERLLGYEKALQDHQIEVPASYIQYCMHGGSVEKEIEKALDVLLTMKKKPEVIFSAGDRLTVGCLRLLKAKKIRVPDDIAMVGFSNSEVMDLFNPPLTIVKQPAFEMGQIATEMLINLIESRRLVTEFEKIVLPAQILTRDSSVQKKKSRSV
ncbi:MAG: LacI family DNA-binding transcriptional regulator, partial [Chitinophagaceae bacterium]